MKVRFPILKTGGSKVGICRMLATVAVFALIQASYSQSMAGAQVRSLQSVGMTVEDMNRSLMFYTHVLPFKKVADFELTGGEYEQLEGVCGLWTPKPQQAFPFFPSTLACVHERKTQVALARILH